MPDKPEKPLWRKAFDAVDRRVAPPLESLVQTGQFAEVVATAMRLQGGVRQFVERRSRQVWHLVNLPAGSDVTRLREQVVSLDRQVRQLTSALEARSPEVNQSAFGGRPTRALKEAPGHGKSDVSGGHGRGNGGPRPARGAAQRASGS